MLHLHKELAVSTDIPEENVFLCEIGDVVAVSSDSARISHKVQAGTVFVDGSGIGDVGNIVLRDRKVLSEEGLAIIAVSIDFDTQTLLSGPDLISRGFVYMRESYGLIRHAEKKIKADINKLLATDAHVEWYQVKQLIIDELSQFLFDKTARRPMILPMIMRINDK